MAWASGGWVRSRRSWAVRAVAAAVLFTTVACGNDDDAGPAATVATTAEATTSQATSTTAATPTVATGDTALGQVLVDGEGFTLYRFTADVEGQSNCTDGCVDTWPPVTPDAELVVGAGLDPTHFGTITRSDGTVQLTVDQLPLYRFAGDTEAGQVNGQGVADSWFVVSPEGELVEDAAPATTTTTAGGELPAVGY